MKNKYTKIVHEYIKAFEEKQNIDFDYWIEENEIAEFSSYPFNFSDIKYDIDNNISEGKIIEWHYDVLENYKTLGFINYKSFCKGLRYSDLQLFQVVKNKINHNVYAGLFSELEKLGLKINKKELKNILESQHTKGLAKYGHTLKDCPDEKYNWSDMAMEELADLLQYIEKK